MPLELSFQFGFIISIGLLGAAFLLWWQASQYPPQDMRRWLDVLLSSSLVAIIVGRGVQVWFVDYRYFEAYPSEIWNIWYGGFNWQGGLMAGLGTMIVLARWRSVPVGILSDGVALCLPLLMMQGWWGCRVGGCGYGSILDEQAAPNWQVGYLPDQFGDVWLRYEWQVLGMLVGLLIWLIISGLTLQQYLVGRRLGLALLLIGVAMLGLSIGRDDGLITRIGSDGTRWLDVLVMVAGFGWLIAPLSADHSTIKAKINTGA